ncbi:hypothetical protein HDV05_000463 [Chytridiales sp. JEL 0842]|nr:hypothetical protein HDV05_000463 [Chytridiales sp. JEL 0842]
MLSHDGGGIASWNLALLVCIPQDPDPALQNSNSSVSAVGMTRTTEYGKCESVECWEYSILAISILSLLFLVLMVLVPSLRSLHATWSLENRFLGSWDEETDESRPLLSGSASSLVSAAAIVDGIEWEVVDKSLFINARGTTSSATHLVLRLLGGVILMLGSGSALYLLLGDGESSSSNIVGWALIAGQWALVSILYVSSTNTVHPSIRIPLNSEAYLVNLELRSQRRRSTLCYLGFYFTLLTLLMYPFTTTTSTFSPVPATLHTASTCLLAALSFFLIQSFPSAGLQRKRRTPGDSVPSPEPDAPWWSVLSLSWLSPLMETGFKKGMLELKDLWDLQPLDNMRSNLISYFDLTQRNRWARNSLGYAMLRVNFGAYLWLWVIVLASTILTFANPWFLRLILVELEEKKEDTMGFLEKNAASVYLILLFFTSTLRVLLENYTTFLARQLGFRVRNVLSGLIYAKTLRLPTLTKSTESTISNGAISNLMSVDATNAADWAGYIHTPFTDLLIILMCVGFLVYLLGLAGILGLGCMLFFIFIGGPLANHMRKGFGGLKKLRDERVEAIREVLTGIKVLKYYAWESYFLGKIKAKRAEELSKLFWVTFQTSMNRVLWYSAPIFTTGVTLGSYTKLFGGVLDAPRAFTALSLFVLLRNPLQLFADTVVQLMDAWVSFRRVETFLGEAELEGVGELGVKFFDEESCEGGKAFGVDTGFVGFRDASIGYSTSTTRASSNGENMHNDDDDLQDSFTLKNLKVEFPHGKLTALIGPTASGKSTLLASLLCETHLLSGHISLGSRKVAYVPQTPWLLNDTIRENILFGQPFDEHQYVATLKACALVKDLKDLPEGDFTQIGERGLAISGGQRQRISLARALYSNADVVLLDDPLSALDAPTARWVFEKAVLEGLRGKGKTVVLVTGRVGLVMPCVDYVVMLEEGEVYVQGSVEQVLGKLEGAGGGDGFGRVVVEMKGLIVAEREKFLNSGGDSISAGDGESVDFGDGVTELKLDVACGGGTLLEKEKVATGAVSSEVYLFYIDAIGGCWILLLVLVGYLINHGLAIGQDLVISFWTKAYRLNESSSTSFKQPVNEITNRYLIIYTVAAILCILSIFLRLLLLLVAQYRAALKIHELVLRKVMRAPLRFFETTPLGRLMNHFSKDVVSVDFEVGLATGNMLFCAVAAVTVLAAVSSLVPQLLIPLVPIAIVYIRIGHYFIRTARSLKRLDSVLRSPVFSHFGETLSGITVIRAFGASQRFMKESIKRFNDSTRASYFLMVSGSWLAVRIQTVGTTVVFVAGLMVLGLGPEWVGLVLNLLFGLTDSLMNLVKQHSYMEMAYNSVERCREYLEIEEEAEEVNKNYRPPVNWPSRGHVEIKDLEIRYAPHLEPALKSISATFEEGRKVGIVGRTGAGKSSLAAALFRMVEPSGGTIAIDGVDIRRLGLKDLREAITIIPQDPVLFTGTIRSNLDPFEAATDAKLWEALKRAHVIPSSNEGLDAPPTSHRSTSSATVCDSMVDSQTAPKSSSNSQQLLQLGLDSQISDGGAHLSSGQRQLICLARALVCRSRVIVFDEATSSVDDETDVKIQETLRTEFKKCTVVTIAHRLKTVADFDQIIVIDKGVVVEDGTPLSLMTEGGVFRGMCEESGEWDELLNIAAGMKK